jgi:hypothetical protein
VRMKVTMAIVALFLAFMAINTLPAQACELRGYTPGFWKQEQHFEYWPDGMEPYKFLGQCFVFPEEMIPITYTHDFLIDALGFRGGSDWKGGSRILLRAAVAALLNAMYFGEFDISEGHSGYYYTPCEVIGLVNAALASLDRGEMLSLACELDFYNNQG